MNLNFAAIEHTKIDLEYFNNAGSFFVWRGVVLLGLGELSAPDKDRATILVTNGSKLVVRSICFNDKLLENES